MDLTPKGIHVQADVVQVEGTFGQLMALREALTLAIENAPSFTAEVDAEGWMGVRRIRVRMAE